MPPRCGCWCNCGEAGHGFDGRGTGVTPELWQRVRAVLDDLPDAVEERGAYLDDACDGDAELRRRVAALERAIAAGEERSPEGGGEG